MSAPILSFQDPKALARAVDVLASGGLVGLPTETVYGLAADATQGEAVARIYSAKGRPSFNPLIAHVTDQEMARRLVTFHPLALKLAQAFWPGPITLVLPRTETCPVSELASAGLDTLAVRAPAHPTAQALIGAFGKPIVAPSANPSYTISPTTAEHVANGLGDKVGLIVDGGAARIGLESTVIGFSGDTPLLLRKGGLARADIEAVCGPLSLPDRHSPKASPGMLSRHYAPSTPVRLKASTAKAGEVLLGFGQMECDLNLSPSGDLVEAAANLFAHLRKLDQRGVLRIAIADIPEHGLGEAINDRLRRAATPRDEHDA